MRDNAERFAEAGIAYLPHVEPARGAGKGLLEALAADACVVVADTFPAFFLPRMLAAAAAKVPVRFEEVDSNGLLPLSTLEREFTRAFSFRIHLQKVLPAHLARDRWPVDDPLASGLGAGAKLPTAILRRFPAAPRALLDGDPSALAALPIDHTVHVAELQGGERAGLALLDDFVKRRVARYAEERSEPESDASSGLSPYLHWGHVSAHQALAAVGRAEKWSPSKLVPGTSKDVATWWGVSPSAAGFLDELVTWRELGYAQCRRTPDTYDRYEALPAWARASLEKHRTDPRPALYTLAQLEHAKTSDPLWNAAQRQLVRSGVMHNYLRMLWGKRVLEWTADPREAFDLLVHLNNKYALDGRNPNSWSGISWVFGRYDRPWGPERPVYGLIRYMSSENTARKFRVKGYLAQWAEEERPGQVSLFG